jgi:hypothetical membrane protein
MKRTEALLRCGVIAGPLYLGIGLLQALTREGFDMRRHALSHLSNGDLGWIQIGNFLLAGFLVILGAVGVRLALRGERAGTWGPVLLAVYGIGLVGAGVFVADPAPDFPVGALVGATGMSRAGLLHFVFGGIGFYALIAACLVFAYRFFRARSRGWALYSALTGIGFFASFAAIASGSTATATMVTFYFAVAWVWIWHSAVLMRVRSAMSFG